ncbi:hypothetical protein BD410DRAFT_897248 [Rickenella mellea]|uniref:AAA-ATPase-like domain-containing protein n=1 Tax=Rickenella mellea TaxID=50990 RepID=A0A4Y7Q9X0_9AGAM|nr:hypothetical protein BD410DRAFT_897248 [Rickenella mellea]
MFSFVWNSIRSNLFVHGRIAGKGSASNIYKARKNDRWLFSYRPLVEHRRTMATYNIRCYIAGHKLILPPIELDGDKDTADLRKAVYVTAAAMSVTLPAGLVLCRPIKPMPLSKSSTALNAAITGLFLNGQYLRSKLQKLEWSKISKLFPDSNPPPEGHLHIVACLPEGVYIYWLVHLVISSLADHVARSRSPRRKPDLQFDLESENGVRPRAVKRRRLNLLPGSDTIYRTEGKVDEPMLLPTPTMGFDELTKFPNLIAADKTKYIELLDKLPKYQCSLPTMINQGAIPLRMTFAIYTLANIPHRAAAHSSSFNALKTIEDTERQFHEYMFTTLRTFLITNQEFLKPIGLKMLDRTNGAQSLRRVFELVKRRGEKIFVGVDDYDAPAISFLFSPNEDKFYQVDAFFKTQFFAIIKQATSSNVILKYWITGILPVFRDGPLSATQILSHETDYHGLHGLTDSEVQTIAQAYLSPTLEPQAVEDVVKTLRSWCGGYQFSPSSSGTRLDPLYNPQHVFKHLRGLVKPRNSNFDPQDEIRASHVANVLNAIPNDDD